MSVRKMRKVIARLNAWLEAENRAVAMDELRAKVDELFVAELVAREYGPEADEFCRSLFLCGEDRVIPALLGLVL